MTVLGAFELELDGERGPGAAGASSSPAVGCAVAGS